MNPVGRQHARDFDVPGDLGDPSFFDVFSDIFTPPEWLPLSRPDYGFTAPHSRWAPHTGGLSQSDTQI